MLFCMHTQYSRQGKAERAFILEDERYKLLAKEWVRSCGVRQGSANATVSEFRAWCNKTLLPLIKLESPEGRDPFRGLAFKKIVTPTPDGDIIRREISDSTARCWLHKLGCRRTEAKGGVYYDGHDRKDVLRYRVEDYLPVYLDMLEYSEVWIKATADEALAWGVVQSKEQLGCRLEYEEEEEEELRDGWVWVSGEEPFVWVNISELEETRSTLPPELQGRLQSKKTFEGGKRALFLWQDECIYKCEH